eukprot:2631659-Pleurochrysis_carterae.AAC.1
MAFEAIMQAHFDAAWTRGKHAACLQFVLSRVRSLQSLASLASTSLRGHYVRETVARDSSHRRERWHSLGGQDRTHISHWAPRAHPHCDP